MDWTNKTLLFQGDSITDCGRERVEGPNASLGKGYVFLASANILANYADSNIKIFNRGISGNRIVDLYARWKVDCLHLKPDVLSILIGINDTWHGFKSDNGVELERYQRFYKELLEWTRKDIAHVRLVLCEPFMLPTGAADRSWLDEVNHRGKIVKDLANQFDAIFIPFQTVFNEATKRAPMEYWLYDGVHPSMAGHHLMSETWLKAVLGS